MSPFRDNIAIPINDSRFFAYNGIYLAGEETAIIQSLLTVSILMFGAMLGGMLCRRIRVAAVVGEILAGVLLAPTLLGGILIFGLHPVVLNAEVNLLAEAGIILLIFLAGLETSFKRFIGSSPLAAMVAAGGVIVSFIISYALCALWGLGLNELLMISAATTATSVSITYRTLKDLNVSQTDEGIILISSAVIDDVLGLITLAIVLGIVGGTSISIVSIGVTTAKAIGAWVAMLVLGAFLLVKIIDRMAPALKKYAASTMLSFATCFAFAWAAGITGLSPIVGSFVAGVTIAETHIRDLATKMATDMSTVLAVLFFAYTGAQASIASVSARSLIFSALLVIVSIIGKIIGCGLPVLIVRRNIKEMLVVGIGMVPRVEVGLIIATMGLARGILSKDYYSSLIIMAIATTVFTPLTLKYVYKLFAEKDAGTKRSRASGHQ